ncbi:MAG: tRNA lysidine(34) synthetase TilS [Pseudomonadota bacterium]
MPDSLDAESLLPALAPWRDAPRWWVGLSGGVDSMVLLDLMATLRDQHSTPPLSAVHINHQLQQDANSWQQHCQQSCEQKQVAFVSQSVSVDLGGTGPEAAARAARYAAFESLLRPGELLLLAHHLDDQIETFFLRLMRGAGARGLAGMPVSRQLGNGALLRPLLSVPRQAIAMHANARSLSWCEDPSNKETELDRNFLRHELMPVLNQRWPAYRDSIARSQAALAQDEQDQRGRDHSLLDNASLQRAGDIVLDLSQLAADTPSTLARLLRRWLGEQGLVLPASDRLLEFARQLQTAAPDRQPALQGEGYSLQRHQSGLHRVSSVALPSDSLWLTPDTPLELAGLGWLSVRPTNAVGLRLPEAGGWSVRWRKGGERCQPLSRSRSQSLKKLLQETGLAPWQRDRLPLLYSGEELAAVADLWICRGAEASSDSPAYNVHWEL